MKKLLVVLLVLAIVAAAFAGCSKTDSKKTEAATEADKTEAQETEATLTYYGNDVSEHKDLNMYVIGDEPAMADEVETAINELLETKLNVTLDIHYIPLSDYETKYSLLLASDGDIDIIYSAAWAGYFAEARKSAYMEITTDMIEKYMPQANEGISKLAYESIKVDGKIYMIPSWQIYAQNAVPVLVRGDLREKYGMDEIDSYEKLEEYMYKVLEEEDGIYPYAAGTNGVEISIQMYQCYYDLVPSTSYTKYFGYYYTGNNMPTADDMVFQYSTDEYREYCKLMKKWADAGFWSTNALSNSISPADAFINGTSAVCFWNYDTLKATYNTVMNDHPEWKPEVVDVNPNGARPLSPFNQGYSLPANAKNAERSLMVMDVICWDKEVYDIARYGIEGESWIATSDTTYTLGERQGDYVVGNSPLTWGAKNDTIERILGEAGSTKDPLYVQLFGDPLEEATSGFIFDDTEYANEVSKMSQVCSKYIPSLELGLVQDVDATLDEFLKACENAGINELFEEYKKQYAEYLKGVSFE